MCLCKPCGYCDELKSHKLKSLACCLQNGMYHPVSIARQGLAKYMSSENISKYIFRYFASRAIDLTAWTDTMACKHDRMLTSTQVLVCLR